MNMMYSSGLIRERLYHHYYGVYITTLYSVKSNRANWVIVLTTIIDKTYTVINKLNLNNKWLIQHSWTTQHGLQKIKTTWNLFFRSQMNNIKVNKEKSKLLAKRSGKEKTIQ